MKRGKFAIPQWSSFYLTYSIKDNYLHPITKGLIDHTAISPFIKLLSKLNIPVNHLQEITFSYGDQEGTSIYQIVIYGNLPSKEIISQIKDPSFKSFQHNKIYVLKSLKENLPNILLIDDNAVMITNDSTYLGLNVLQGDSENQKIDIPEYLVTNSLVWCYINFNHFIKKEPYQNVNSLKYIKKGYISLKIEDGKDYLLGELNTTGENASEYTRLYLKDMITLFLNHNKKEDKPNDPLIHHWLILLNKMELKTVNHNLTFRYQMERDDYKKLFVEKKEDD